jgi:hypothetical protein
MPGTVSEVSATLVASTIRRALCGAGLVLLLRLRREKSGSTSTRADGAPQLLGSVADLPLAGKEDEHVAGAGGSYPRPSPACHARLVDGVAIASPRSWSRLLERRQRISTG